MSGETGNQQKIKRIPQVGIRVVNNGHYVQTTDGTQGPGFYSHMNEDVFLTLDDAIEFVVRFKTALMRMITDELH